jgi:hypothetical protein
VLFCALFLRPARICFLTVAAHLSLEVLDLRERRILTTCSEEITKVAERDTAVAALVEEGEGLLEVCALRLLVHGWLAVCGMSGIVLFVRTLCCLRARECAGYCERLKDRRKKNSRLRGFWWCVVVDKRAGDFGFGSVSRSSCGHTRKGRCRVLLAVRTISADVVRRSGYGVLVVVV